MELHWNILDKKRKSILPLLKNFSKQGFYLAGGTGIALQIGHRDSIDFDFFRKGAFDTGEFIEKLESVFKGHKVFISQQQKNTVSCEIDDDIRLSFMTYDYELQKPLVKSQHFEIASLEDIACMKLSAITGRAVEKDFVDLYFILQKNSLPDLFDFCEKKYPSFNRMIALKSLSFFGDVLRGELIFKEGHKISWEKVKKNLKESVMQYSKQYTRKQELGSIRKNKKERGMER